MSTSIGRACFPWQSSINEWNASPHYFTVLRLLTPLKMSYEAAKKRAEPYTKIVEALPEMRRDTLGLVKQAVGENRKAYVLVSNRSERNAPLTIQALRHALQATES